MAAEEIPKVFLRTMGGDGPIASLLIIQFVNSRVWHRLYFLLFIEISIGG